MDLLSSMRISATGLSAQSARLETIASNMANAESVGYKRKDPVFVPSTDREAFGEILKDKFDEHAQGVLVSDIVEDERPPRLEYRPSHPQARPDGYVEMPNVNPIVESTNMIAAQRAYEANVAAINAAKAMALKSLEIGK